MTCNIFDNSHPFNNKHNIIYYTCLKQNKTIFKCQETFDPSLQLLFKCCIAHESGPSLSRIVRKFAFNMQKKSTGNTCDNTSILICVYSSINHTFGNQHICIFPRQTPPGRRFHIIRLMFIIRTLTWKRYSFLIVAFNKPFTTTKNSFVELKKSMASLSAPSNSPSFSATNKN